MSSIFGHVFRNVKCKYEFTSSHDFVKHMF